MKRTVLAFALGIVASVAPAYGQGYIIFSNHGTTTDAIVTDCGGPANSSFTAGLVYQFGGAPPTLSTATQSFDPVLPGYFTGPIVQVPGYFEGPITFQVVAYAGADYASSVLKGASAAFTLPSIATEIQIASEFGPSLRPFVACLPESGTIVLVGFGLVSLLMFRRN